MTTKPKSRAKKRHARSSQQSTPASAGTFRMVAAANPGPSLDVGPELDLVKAALLYGDKVTVISPVTTMLMRAERLQHSSSRHIIELIRRVAPALLSPDELPEFERGLEQADHLLRATPRGGLTEQLLKRALQQVLEPGQRMLSEAVRNISARAGIDQLARARREGLVKIENADPGDETELLASCIISAKLAETGQRQDDPQTHRLIGGAPSAPGR